MDRFEAMKVLVRIVELRSFTRAAEDLQLPRATVTHVVQQLEKRLGVRLLHRTTRQVSPTLDGEAYYQRCQRLLADLEETEAVFNQAALKPKGKLRVDLQGTLAGHFLLPHLGEFFERYPELELEIGLGDRLIDLVREGVDCVLRAGEPRDSSSLVGRRVALLEQVTCASAGYIERHGEPRTLEEFQGQGHRAVNFVGSNGKILPFDFIDGSGRAVQLQLPGLVTVSNAEAYKQCCAAGLGFVQHPRYHVEQQLADGRLREVLADFRPAPMPVSLFYPQQRQLSQRVRVFVDWVAAWMQQQQQQQQQAPAA